MIKVINACDNIKDLYVNNIFMFDRWREYIEDVVPGSGHIFVDDMNKTINECKLFYERDYLPILNNVITSNKIDEVIKSFREATYDLDNKVKAVFNRTPNVYIILCLGLCNGAGWAIKDNGNRFIFLGIEKIIELNWGDYKSMHGLITHELGHIYQMQFGKLDRYYEGKDEYLWKLYTEGIAMYFEQALINDFNFFHQDKDNWLIDNDNELVNIINDFNRDLSIMTINNQRYFGDLVRYNGRSDVGYYLGARFVYWILRNNEFDRIIKQDIKFVSNMWNMYINEVNENE